jgi:hypothetical protein
MSIKVDELRLGNWVHDLSKHDGGKDIQINRIFTGSDYSNYWKNIHPIKITQDILLKCSFKFNDENRVDWIKGAFNLERKEESFYFEVYSHYNEIKHLHQLQNLYFVLTGKELTYKK